MKPQRVAVYMMSIYECVCLHVYACVCICVLALACLLNIINFVKFLKLENKEQNNIYIHTSNHKMRCISTSAITYIHSHIYTKVSHPFIYPLFICR